MTSQAQAAPHKRTYKVQGEHYHTAGELHHQIGHLEAKRDELPEYGPQRRQVDEHLSALRAAHDQAREHEQAEQTRKDRKAQRDQERRRQASTKQRQQASSSVRRGFRGLAGSSRRTGGRAAGALGLDEKVGSATDLTLWTLGSGALLILLYLAVNERGRGPAALQGLVNGTSGVFKRVLDPADPLLFAKGSAAAQAAGTSTPTSTSTPAPPAPPVTLSVLPQTKTPPAGGVRVGTAVKGRPRVTARKKRTPLATGGPTQ